MAPRIAIPEPTSDDPEYNQRALPQYLEAIKAAGADPVVVHLADTREQVANLLASVQGILLPGSGHDVDPALYGEAPAPETASNDIARAVVDEILLQNAFNQRKPVLTICHGTQTLNVWRGGTLIQDLKTPVNHKPGREVVEAHPVRIEPRSRLTEILAQAGESEAQVNSSHHQAIRNVGNDLRVTAVSPRDGVVEAVELESPNHFVVGVQWHPERTYAQSEFSRAMFSAFVDAAVTWQQREIPASVHEWSAEIPNLLSPEIVSRVQQALHRGMLCGLHAFYCAGRGPEPCAFTDVDSYRHAVSVSRPGDWFTLWSIPALGEQGRLLLWKQKAPILATEIAKVEAWLSEDVAREFVAVGLSSEEEPPVAIWGDHDAFEFLRALAENTAGTGEFAVLPLTDLLVQNDLRKWIPKLHTVDAKRPNDRGEVPVRGAY